jgi:hypothetical protein
MDVGLGASYYTQNVLCAPRQSFVISKYSVSQTHHMITYRIVNNKYVGSPDELPTQRRLGGDSWEYK